MLLPFGAANTLLSFKQFKRHVQSRRKVSLGLYRHEFLIAADSSQCTLQHTVTVPDTQTLQKCEVHVFYSYLHPLCVIVEVLIHFHLNMLMDLVAQQVNQSITPSAGLRLFNITFFSSEAALGVHGA